MGRDESRPYSQTKSPAFRRGFLFPEYCSVSNSGVPRAEPLFTPKTCQAPVTPLPALQALVSPGSGSCTSTSGRSRCRSTVSYHRS